MYFGEVVWDGEDGLHPGFIDELVGGGDGGAVGEDDPVVAVGLCFDDFF